MKWYQQVRDAMSMRDTRFSTYDDTAPQCSYPYAVKMAWYEELVTCHVPCAPTWDASIKVDYDHGNRMSMRALRETAAYLAKKRIPVPREIPYSINAIKGRSVSIRVTRVHVGRTRKGLHLRLWLDPYIGGSCPIKSAHQYTVLRIQEMLGDDPVRQKFNRGRVRRHRKGWNILFTSKLHNGQVTSCERFDLRATLRVQKVFEDAGIYGPRHVPSFSGMGGNGRADPIHPLTEEELRIHP